VALPVPQRLVEADVRRVEVQNAKAAGAAHAVLDAGRWTWILGPAFLDALRHGRCLDGSPLP